MRLILFILLVFIALSCRKNKIEPGKKHLPRATEKGRGIFGCYVGNRTYVARYQPAVVYNQDDGYLFIENSFSGNNFRFFVYEGMYYEGLYKIDSTGEDYFRTTVSFSVFTGGKNELNVTKLDPINKIVSGTFDFEMREVQTGEIIRIRDGRFDLKISVVG